MEQNQSESLGQHLKSIRESKNISLEQIAYATRISLKMLRALEDDDQTTLPAPTFVRGYLQAYAKYVRTEPQELLQKYHSLLATAPEQEGAIKSHYLYVRERYQEKRRLVMVIVLFATMLSVAGTYFLLKAKREKNKETATRAEEILKPQPAAVATATTSATTNNSTTNTQSVAAVSTDTKTEKKAAPTTSLLATEVTPTTRTTANTSTKTTTATSTASATGNTAFDQSKDEKKAFNLLLKAETDVWLRFQTDSSEVKDLTLRTGRSIMLRGNKVIKIFSGNLSALQGTLNGSDLTRLSSDPKAKSAVIPESEAPNYPLPLFPQFQTTTPKPDAASGNQ